MFRGTLLLGVVLLSSVARATSPNAAEPASKLPVLSPALLGFQFDKASPNQANATAAGPLSQPIKDFGKIVELPKILVEAHQALPSKKEVLTDYGRLQAAKNEFTTPLYRATFGPLSQVAAYYFNFLTILNGWHPSDAEAMALYRESERAQILTDFDDFCELEKLRDPRDAEKLRRMRTEIWRTGFDSLYWDPSAGTSGIHVGKRKR